MKKILLTILVVLVVVVSGVLGYAYYFAKGSSELVQKNLSVDGYNYSLLFPKTVIQRGNKLGSVSGGNAFGAVMLKSTPASGNGCEKFEGKQAYVIT